MRFWSFVILVVVLAACGGNGADSTPGTASTPISAVPDAPASTVAPSGEAISTTVAPRDAGTTTTRPAPNPDRQLAPDFSLTLSDGIEYQLANETRPVYLVFWAEW
ncbi:MAG: hypothetical protein WD990_11050 [Acidimicrobiia bacterium]